jgi:S-DNA-T family DNA segregation ATPase FtsK/SpoIIIE
MARKKGKRRRSVTFLGMPAEVWQDLAALLVFLIFIFVTLSLIAPDLAGESSQAVHEFLLSYLGLAAYPLPLFILVLGFAALPLRAQPTLLGYSWKLAVLDIAFCLLAGYYYSGGAFGGWVWRNCEPVLGVFYPILLYFLLAGLVIAFIGRGVLLPGLRWLENLSDDLRNAARQKAAAAELKRRREMLEAEAAEEVVEDEAPAPEDTAATEAAISPGDTSAKVTAAKDATPADPPKVGQQAFRFAAAYEDYKFPPISLLSDVPFSAVAEDILQRNAQVIVETLKAFNIESEVSCWEIGPRVTRFELRIAPGINVSRLHALADNLALELAVPAVRLETPIPGKSAVGIEVPNRKFNKIALRSLLDSAELKAQSHPLAVPIGRDIAGKPVIGNIHHMHHLLVAGSTGSGKSVCLNEILVSLMYRNSPASLRLILIDPKRVEMSVFKDTPHLAAPIVHDINEAQSALKWVVAEMESRLRAFEEHGVRNIDAYNEKPPATGPLPYILVVIDELADLIKAAGPVFERLIGRIAHLARATGIHLIVATQRPDAKIITGNIKMNIPSRIAFAVVSQIDSRTIIDMPGAEKLLGSGDMLYFPVGIPKPLRVQGAWVRDEEVKRVAEFLRKQTKPDYIEDITAFAPDGEEDWDSNGNGGNGDEMDELYGDAMDIITRAGRASTSLLQRRLKIGYNRAARIMEQMEQQGVVSPADHQGNRELLIAPQAPDEDF